MAGTPEDLTEHDERRLDAAAVSLGSAQRSLREPVRKIERIYVGIEFSDGGLEEVEVIEPRAATLARSDEQWILTDVETGEPKIESPRLSILRLTVTGVGDWFWVRP